MLSAVAIAVLASPVSLSADAEWDSWKAQHDKVYKTSAEHDLRKMNWMRTREEIISHNAKGASWTAGLNAFSDLTWDEFKAEKLMTPQNCSATHTASGNWKKGLVEDLLPDAIDWRDEIEKITPWPVKNQGHCGSCWTFSTVGSMEAHYILKHSQAKNLSEQQLVDCAGAFNNFGCNGGLPSQAFEYLHYVGGHDTETIYPYTAKDGPCTYSGQGVAQVRAVNNITAFDEIELQEAVGTYGPVSIAYQVSSDFRNYKEGVYDGVCQDQPEDVNHAVVVVGYGKQTPGGKYWTLRNSWGETFGMDGYFKMARGKNKCGISDCASFPSVA